MKTVIQTNYTGIDSLKITNIPIPKINPIESLINVKYVPVLPYDLKMENGAIKKKVNIQNLPHTIGYSFAGIIENNGILKNKDLIGKKVIGISQGGTLSEYISLNTSHYAFLVPDNVSLSEASTIFGGADTALMAIQELGIKPGDTVLISGGSGGIGTYLIQMLNLLDVNTSILSSEKSKHFLTKHFNNPVYTSSKYIDDNHYDYLIDTTGNSNIVKSLENKVLVDGTIFPLSLPNYTSSRKNINISFYNQLLIPSRYNELLMMLSQKTIKSFIDSIYDFNNIKQAQEKLYKHGKKGRILVKLT